jgi:hypothetical protein
MLAIGLCGAVASHYYAGLVLIPLTAGELVRTQARGKTDWPVWLAFGGALVPVASFAPTILSAKAYSTHFWAIPHIGAALNWYFVTVGYALFLPLAAFGVGILFRVRTCPTGSTPEKLPRAWYSVTILLLALLPLFGVVTGVLITHAYTERYMIAATLGLCILLIHGLRRIIGDDTLMPGLVCALCLIFFGIQIRGMHYQQVQSLQDTKASVAFLRRTNDALIAMAEITPFHRVSFYARRDLARRLAYVADPHLSIRYLGHDTVDRGLLDLNRWFPLNVVWWHDWLSTHPSFLVYGYIGDWSWLTFELPSVSDSIELVERLDKSRLLFSVKHLKVPADDRTARDPSGQPMLYQQLPDREAPLCTIYMTDGCPVIDGESIGAAQE